MKSRLKWTGVLAVLLTVLLQQQMVWGQLRIHSGAAAPDIEHPKALEQRIFELTNEERRKNGLAPLELDKELTAKAWERGEDMLKTHYFSKTQPDQSRKRFDEEEPAISGAAGKVGENIHMALKQDYSDLDAASRFVVNHLMDSPLRANILNPAWTRMGVGISIKGKESYVVQEFGGNQ